MIVLKDGRENLVLVNAFYTNSAILQGLIDFLSDTFNVYFIDLPGFAADVPPLEDISVEGFAHYVRRRIDGFGLEHFVLGGISFGFLVANRVPLNGECRGILGITPYLDRKSLKLRPASDTAIAWSPASFPQPGCPTGSGKHGRCVGSPTITAVIPPPGSI